jgi:hydrogenase 3 maturation protease
MDETKTLNSSWKKQLCQTLAKKTAEHNPARLTVLGIGNDLNGDDAAGALVARSLLAVCGQYANLQAVDGGSAPENSTGKIRRFMPHLVLMVDAADFGGKPGEVRMLEAADMDGFSASTHSLPPSVLAAYLGGEMGCAVAFAGIQAQSLEFDTPPSAPVRRACRQIAGEVIKFMDGTAASRLLEPNKGLCEHGSD